MNNSDFPAMPNPTDKLYEIIKGSNPDYEKASAGLTKREMFAMHAMQGYLSMCGGNERAPTSAEEVAYESVCYADALLEELAK